MQLLLTKKFQRIVQHRCWIPILNDTDKEPKVDDIVLILQLLRRFTVYAVENFQTNIGRQLLLGWELSAGDIKAVELCGRTQGARKV